MALWRKSKRSSSSRTRKNIVDILRFNLRKEGYDTLEAFDGVTGLRLALEESPDLILLDLMLPEMNGFEVCKLLRDKGEKHPGADYHRPGGGEGQNSGPGPGGGRLHHQALLRAGAAGPGEGQHPPGGADPAVRGKPGGPPGFLAVW